jgi:ferritin-like metal-binding protein YciE
MKTKTSKKSQSNGNQIDKGMHSSQLMELFEEQLKDILWAEKALIKAIPNMISLASSEDLIEALKEHMEETKEQVNRLEKVFKTIDKKPSTVKCDAGIIAAAQKIEHYEIATYGTLREFAETLGLKDAEKLLLETLKEEKAADQTLTKVAVKVVNMDAAVKQA